MQERTQCQQKQPLLIQHTIGAGAGASPLSYGDGDCTTEEGAGAVGESDTFAHPPKLGLANV